MRRLLIILILLFGCVSSDRTQDTFIQPQQIEDIKPDSDTKEQAFQLISQVPGPKIRIEFFISLEDRENYPMPTFVFLQALTQWVNELPLECIILITKEKPDRDGIITVDFDDVVEGGVLGKYIESIKTMKIHTKSIGDNSHLATSVCLHELGHIFGVPHFANSLDVKAYAGDVIIDNADTYLMYRELDEETSPLTISKEERKIALNYTKNILPYKLSGKL